MNSLRGFNKNKDLTGVADGAKEAEWDKQCNATFTIAQLQDDQMDRFLKNKVAEKVNWARCAYVEANLQKFSNLLEFR